MAVDIFLELSNNIKGEAQDAVHKDKIDIMAWSWGLSNSGTTHMGTGGGGGKVNVQDISFTKKVDLSSNDLIKKCCDGTHIDSGMLTVRKAGTTPLEYFRIKFERLMITSYTTGGSNADELDRITEHFTLNFARFHIIYQLQDDTGIGGAEALAGWDIPKNENWTAA